MKYFFILTLFICHLNTEASQFLKANIVAYYTHLPYNDGGFTGRYADIIVDVNRKGKFVFSREFGYLPYWQAISKDKVFVSEILRRIGDGPKYRPDNINRCSNVSIICKTENSVTVHWRYAPDITKLAFTNYNQAYNAEGNPALFYADYADEYFTINADGKVTRIVKNASLKSEEWNDATNQFTQNFELASKGIVNVKLQQPKLSAPTPLKSKFTPVNALNPSENLIANFKFDEAVVGAYSNAHESVSNSKIEISGSKAHWHEGVSGTCLFFDSYSNAVIQKGMKIDSLIDEFSVEAWVAPQEYPFNLAAIIDLASNNSGILLAMTARGEIYFKVGASDSKFHITSQVIPLYKWTHIVATFQKDNRMCLYINGQLVTVLPASNGVQLKSPVDLSIGMTRSFKQYPLGAERNVTRNFASNFVFSGLIDEVSISKKCVDMNQVMTKFEKLKPQNLTILKPALLPYGPNFENNKFEAQYCKLNYLPQWDELWRVGKFADLVVTFENKPWRYVFWRGTRYLPSLVTGSGIDGIWVSDQGPEQFNGRCFEHMSDMQNRFSSIRLIENSPARKVIHWRNASVDIGYQWISSNSNGWGVWTDEYWTIYPDGTAVRHQINHNSTIQAIHEMNQSEILLHPGQVPENVINDDGVTMANHTGQMQTWSRSKLEPSNTISGNCNLQYLNIKATAKHFQLGEIGSRVNPEINKDVYWLGWNHYPIQLIPSDGTLVLQPDRPSSSCIATFYEKRNKLSDTDTEAMTIVGLTDQSVGQLNTLNKSWNNTAAIVAHSGCESLGYVKPERAYYLSQTNNPKIHFSLKANSSSPVVNPVFVFKKWNRKVPLKLTTFINDHEIQSSNVKYGIEIDTDGSPMLIMWFQITSELELNFDIRIS